MLAPHESPHGLRHALGEAAHHTGLPLVVVAAIALVVSWRIFRSFARLAIEVVVALALLIGLTRLGVIRW